MIQTIQSDLVSAEVVTTVGHIAPVTFQLEGGATARPYSVAPWTPEECEIDLPLLQWLRGDFFCLPFGETEGIPGVHGPAANGPWEVVEQAAGSLKLGLDLAPALEQPGSRLEKVITLRDGHRVLYNQHTISGLSGRYNYGHHPVLHIPEGQTCALRTNAFQFGSVFPGQFGDPKGGETCILKEGATFDSLDAVPLAEGGTLSLASYPTERRHEDLVMLSASKDLRLGWTALSYPDYVWVSIRSVAQFPSTLLWISNGGREQEPWKGKHTRRIGVEDVCSHFHNGAHLSRLEPMADQGIATSREFTATTPTVIRHAQFVHPVSGSRAVADIQPADNAQAVTLRFEDGSETTAPLDWQWLTETDPA